MANMLGLRILPNQLRHSYSRFNCPTWGRRQYHSYEHEPAPPFTSTETAILSAALTHVPTQGFTLNSLASGARDTNYRDVSINLFPAGAFALVQYHLVTQRLALGNSKESNQLPKSGIAANIQKLALKRLHANSTIIHQWQEVGINHHSASWGHTEHQQALAIMAIPANIPTSLHELGLLSDEILFQAGDTSVNSSWYTKRAALGTVYASTELFMTTDRSPNFVETEAFLSRRLEESRGLGNALRNSGSWLGHQAVGVLNGLRSKGVRI